MGSLPLLVCLPAICVSPPFPTSCLGLNVVSGDAFSGHFLLSLKLFSFLNNIEYEQFLPFLCQHVSPRKEGLCVCVGGVEECTQCVSV